MRRLPSLSALRAFATVARAGSFSRAALELNVSNSAVSHQLRTLEAELGRRLLVRARSGAGRTTVTEDGAALLAAVDSAFAQIGDACDAVRRVRLPRLVVSASGTVVSLWLARRVAAFAAGHPSVQWQVRAIEHTPDLDAEGVDLAMIRVPRGTAAPPDHMLFSETVFPVCSPSLAPSVRAETLAGLSLLEEDHGSATERAWSTWLALLGAVAPRPALVRFDTFAAVAAAALAGIGVALGRSPMLDDDLTAGRLVRPFGPVSLPGSSDFVLRIRPGAARDPHVVKLRDALKQAV